MDESKIALIVEEVINKIRQQPQAGGAARPVSVAAPAPGSQTGLRGVFKTMDDAVNAAWETEQKYGCESVEIRKKAIAAIRAVALQNKEDFGERELDETKLGRLDHKIEKVQTCANMTPGVEDLPTQAWTGDHGLTVEEYAPYGVIGAVTPVTHAVPTMINNAISFLAGGNTAVFNAHPASKRIFAYAMDKLNRAIFDATGYENLITCIDEPTIESGRELFNHPKVRVLLVTGGPGVVREALKAGKKAITAGPGNPPVVVDETAVMPQAARDIILGAGYDNNILCIGEKEVFVVDSVADKLIAEMKRLGCVQLTAQQIDALAKQAFECKGDHKTIHGCAGTTLNRDLVGRSAYVLAQSIGLQVSQDCPLLIGETDFANPWVQHEQMMMFMPIVRCRDVDEAIDMAVKAEHGYGHTGIIHSLNVRNMTKMAKLMNCSVFVKNGPSYAGLGIGGEGYISFSIASPTGEGITTARTFCRVRRCSMIDYLRIV